jgi:hypothetical protein
VGPQLVVGLAEEVEASLLATQAAGRGPRGLCFQGLVQPRSCAPVSWGRAGVMRWWMMQGSAMTRVDCSRIFGPYN